MKNKFLSFFLISFLFFNVQRAFSQASFSLSPSVCVGTSLTVTANAGTLTATAYTWSTLPFGPIISSPGASVTSIMFPSAGIFTISLGIFTSAGFSYFTATAIVNALPVITVTASEDTICAPQTATLIATGATNFNWIGAALSQTVGAGVAATPSITTVYTVTGATSGCVGSKTVEVVVGNYPSANSALIASSAAVCVGETATLTGNGALHYIWSSTSFTGSTAQQSIAATAGSYTLVLSNGGGCKATLNFYLGIGNCTGIEDLESKRNIALFPNPFNSELVIDLKYTSISEIKFYDSYGKLVFARHFPSSSGVLFHFNGSELSSGIYHVKLVDLEGNISTYKIIKE